jgi:hypothetical protein
VDKANARPRCVTFVHSGWPEVGGAALGLSLSYLPTLMKLAWTNNQQVQNPLAGRKIKTLH